ncbi:MAG: SRPBCC family protein [Bryobacter sp.]|jgi:uncharacterized protein YndB with AHSA1/START domain|nr:SRPBCC family protein [Bryobacter sp.]
MKKALKWLGYAMAAIAGLLALLFVIGLSRPEEVHALAGVEINRPPFEVWETLSNMENLPKWSTEVKEVVRLSENPRRYKVSGAGGSSETEFISMEPPRRFVSKMEMPAMRFSGVWDIRVEPSGAGARVTSDARLRMGNPLLRSMSLFMNANKAEEATLIELKKYLESAGR